jgi:hypothetical protein
MRRELLKEYVDGIRRSGHDAEGFLHAPSDSLGSR